MDNIENKTTSLGNKTKIRELVASFGLPRLIIAGFLLSLFILSPIVGADLPTQITNTINRFSWNAVMVLAMVPMDIKSSIFMPVFSSTISKRKKKEG